MSKHTPGKLIHFRGQPHVLSSEATGPEGKVILLINCDSPSAYVSRQEAEANATRLLTCWNACEGIADPSVVPELLDIAKLILKEWGDSTEGVQRGVLIARLSQYAQEARVVLARAKGLD